jgi:hypothetical protein
MNKTERDKVMSTMTNDQRADFGHYIRDQIGSPVIRRRKIQTRTSGSAQK